MASVPLLGAEEALEASEEPRKKEIEPAVLAADVRAILRRIVKPDDDDSGESVALIAERANTSTRTVYRVLSPNSAETLRLDLADRLCLAANAHLAQGCRLVWPDGRIAPYTS